MMEAFKRRFEELVIYKKVAVIITSILVAIPSFATMFYHVADSFIDQKYVSHIELRTSDSAIIRSIKNIKIAEIQEDILEIDDKEIDGTITNADKKKRLRLQDELHSL